MNININAAASVAGAPRAAARGGEADAKTAESLRQQSTTEAPAGKNPDQAAVDAGDQTGDRDGHGQQVLDVFERGERSKQESDQKDPSEPPHDAPLPDDLPGIDSSGGHLDLQA